MVEHIPGVCGGDAVIAGTRIRVLDIVEYNAWYTPMEIAGQLDLTIGQVQAALDYYDRHRPEIEQDRADDDRAEAELEAKHG